MFLGLACLRFAGCSFRKILYRLSYLTRLYSVSLSPIRSSTL
jgi:hypothetical protein